MSSLDGAAPGVGDLLDDLAAEQRALQDVVASIDADEWLRPTPARGWDVRDTIAHLADTDEMAIATRDRPARFDQLACGRRRVE